MGDINIEDSANAFKKPGTFNLVERLMGRNMPKDDVVVYFDEQSGYEREKVAFALSQETDEAKVKELNDKLDELDATLAESKYTFHMTGISHKTYDEIIDKTREAYPAEYEESIHPITGQKVKAELPSEEREQLYNTLFLTACVESVEDPEGATFNEITPDVMGILLQHAPAHAIRRLLDSANHMRMLGDWMNKVQSADF